MQRNPGPLGDTHTWHLIQMEVGARGIGGASPRLSLERWGGIRGEEKESWSVPCWLSRLAMAQLWEALRGGGSWSSGFRHYRNLECHLREPRPYQGQRGGPQGLYTYCIDGPYISRLLKLNILVFLCFGLIISRFPHAFPILCRIQLICWIQVVMTRERQNRLLSCCSDS